MTNLRVTAVCWLDYAVCACCLHFMGAQMFKQRMAYCPRGEVPLRAVACRNANPEHAQTDAEMIRLIEAGDEIVLADHEEVEQPGLL